MFWKAWDRTRYSINKKIDTLSYDVKGKKILAYWNFRDIRPLILFYSGEDVYFLNSRSAYDYRVKYEGEVIVNFKDKDAKNDKKSYINTSSIHIMKSSEFFRIYKNKQFDTLYQLNNEDARKTINELSNRLESDYLTIQRITINEKYKSVNEVLKSTKYIREITINKSSDDFKEEVNDAQATILHFEELVKILKNMNDNQLTEYKNAENVDQYLFDNYEEYHTKSIYLEVINSENKEKEIEIDNSNEIEM
ncbi:Mbov_0400 family ICE element protein [Mycoplasma sp. CSL7503-lung]|uniref:Mbov_0400 family ICE element protein n=1 Tax=Mycoplasma sp. CSL7503-lung TaxID=536372 RepID=UPI0021D36034|nr:hypothetical protein [Mycoplasma sp. CSL7503-lung]MCU4706454.1 hypothetical protein [Mycoplasma sp. CSL7503-lung]